MRIQELFDLIGAADDFLSLWHEVETTDQLISRLERLKREDPEGILDDLNGLRIAVSSALAANIELGGALSGDGEPVSDIDKALEGFRDLEEPTEATQDALSNQPAAAATAPEEKPTT